MFGPTRSKAQDVRFLRAVERRTFLRTGEPSRDGTSGRTIPDRLWEEAERSTDSRAGPGSVGRRRPMSRFDGGASPEVQRRKANPPDLGEDSINPISVSSPLPSAGVTFAGAGGGLSGARTDTRCPRSRSRSTSPSQWNRTRSPSTGEEGPSERSEEGVESPGLSPGSVRGEGDLPSESPASRSACDGRGDLSAPRPSASDVSRGYSIRGVIRRDDFGRGGGGAAVGTGGDRTVLGVSTTGSGARARGTGTLEGRRSPPDFPRKSRSSLRSSLLVSPGSSRRPVTRRPPGVSTTLREI